MRRGREEWKNRLLKKRLRKEGAKKGVCCVEGRGDLGEKKVEGMGGRIMEREREELKNVRAETVDAAVAALGAATWRSDAVKDAIVYGLLASSRYFG